MAYDVEKDWTTKAGFRAVVILTDRGHRCGYVGVTKSHPLFGVSYSGTSNALAPVADDESIGGRSVIPLLLAACTEEARQRLDVVFDVHGGLTYSDNNEKYPVPSDLWWFGYDCAHAGDGKDPAYLARMRQEKPDDYWLYSDFDGDVPRSLAYCVEQCESLADQLVTRVNLHDTIP